MIDKWKLENVHSTFRLNGCNFSMEIFCKCLRENSIFMGRNQIHLIYTAPYKCACISTINAWGNNRLHSLPCTSLQIILFVWTSTKLNRKWFISVWVNKGKIVCVSTIPFVDKIYWNSVWLQCSPDDKRTEPTGFSLTSCNFYQMTVWEIKIWTEISVDIIENVRNKSWQIKSRVVI